MPLENATKIGELNPLWPLGSDPKGYGDDHIRLLKRTLIALSVDLARVLQGEVSVTAYGAIGDGTLHTLQEWVDEGKYTGLAAIQVAYPKATSLNQSIDYLAIQTALDTGRGVNVPKGTYVVPEEIEQITPGQHVYFENSGGYGYGEDIGLNWLPNTRILAKGAFAGRIRTRRGFRGSSAAPQDAPLSVVWNIQAEAVFLHNPCIWLYCNYADTAPTNLGDYCDVGIFIGCRVGVQILNPQVIGYFRTSGIHFDVTHATTVPRHLNKAGVPYPLGVNVSGADGCGMRNPYIRGARRGLVILGAKPKTGSLGYSDPYYDQQLASVVPDTRGSFGFSDFIVDGGGRVYGPDHHSNWRLEDPLTYGGLLAQASMEASQDDAPCAMYIDGLAGNSSGSLWGMRFIGTRFATFEAFRVRLGRCARIMAVGCHVEGRNGGRYSHLGAPIDTNDYVSTSYGDYAGASFTSRLLIQGSPRTSPTDLYPHYYGTDASAVTDYGVAFYNSYRPSRINADFDFRVGGSDVLEALPLVYRWRFSSTTGCTLSSQGFTFSAAIYGNAFIKTESGTLSLKGAAGVKLYEGSNEIANFVDSLCSISAKSIQIAATEGELDLRGTTLIRFRLGNVTYGSLSSSDFVSETTSTIIRSSTDNVVPFGKADKRASTIYLGSAPIVTSDAGEKEDVRDLTEAEIRVAKALRPRMFRYIGRVRTHCGFIAQEVKGAFEAEGLDAFSYGILCWDSWEENDERPAGSRYALRYEELLCFILGAVLCQ